MGKREDKIQLIINQAITILREEGASSLSMRKVADQCGIRLSNVQYYFPDKEALVKATIEAYFKSCEKDVLGVLPIDGVLIFGLEDVLRKLLTDFLLVGNNSPQCAMFREIWAMSTRNEAVADTMRAYYSKYNEWLVNVIAQYAKNPKQVVSLLLPYFEGYSIMGDTIPQAKEEVVEALISAIMYLER